MTGHVVHMAAVAAAGVLTGNELCTYLFVHRAAARLPLAAEVEFEQQLTRSMMGPMAALMTTTIGAGAALAATSTGTARRLAAGGAIAYSLMLLVTLAGNMPLNAATLAASPDIGETRWRTIRRRWSRLHLARNTLNLTGLTLFVAAAEPRC